VARASEVISGGNIFASFFRSVGYTRKQVLASASRDRHPVSTGDYDAWLVDLDGDLTDTASVHAAAWKRTFDGYLEGLAARQGSAFEPFEIDPDYCRYVDGKPRYDGVDSFLRSRGIVLEWEDPGDPPERETVCGIGNRKNAVFNEVLRTRGVRVFESSVALVRELRDGGKRTAVVTSSKNCEAVLEAAGLRDLFDARVDGNVAERKKLAGNPAPDTSEEAARSLGAAPGRAVVVEDAVSGVRAASASSSGWRVASTGRLSGRAGPTLSSATSRGSS
jgi:trehalose 6-phosphate phosphatase